MDQKPKPKPQKPSDAYDPYKVIKSIAFAWSQLPKDPGPEDLINYARFELARKSKRLFKDPIFDSYTNAEILVEFFAHRFSDPDSAFLKQYKIENGMGELDTFSDWAHEEESKEDKLREERLAALDDTIKFSPKDVGN